MSGFSKEVRRTVSLIADYYDGCKYGCEGFEGFRKSTDFRKFLECIRVMLNGGLIESGRTLFMDLGCADGRVNLLMSYFVKMSLGVEIDSDILAEYGPRRSELEEMLAKEGMAPPPSNIALFAGSSLEDATYRRIYESAGVHFEDIDLFYTYITLHDLFGEKISRGAKPGALYLVYGFSKVLPRYDGLRLIDPDVGGQGIAALYKKEA
jgi:hypothetical protein